MKELITINIELKDRSESKDFLHKLHYKIEDIGFSVITKIPERFIPKFFIDWLDRYTTKRKNELQQQIVKQRWKTTTLEKVIDDIQKKQQSKDE